MHTHTCVPHVHGMRLACTHRYGDISASSWYEMVVLCVYLPTAVAALADALGMLQRIGTAKMLIETDFAQQADKLLLGEAGGPNPNPDETLTEAEFLISVLKVIACVIN